MSMKCTKCCKIKQIEVFPLHRHKCKECMKLINRNYYEKYRIIKNITPRVISDTRKCKLCYKIKPNANFILRCYTCKECNKERNRYYYAKYKNEKKLKENIDIVN